MRVNSQAAAIWLLCQLADVQVKLRQDCDCIYGIKWLQTPQSLALAKCSFPSALFSLRTDSQFVGND